MAVLTIAAESAAELERSQRLANAQAGRSAGVVARAPPMALVAQ